MQYNVGIEKSLLEVFTEDDKLEHGVATVNLNGLIVTCLNETGLLQ